MDESIGIAHDQKENRTSMSLLAGVIQFQETKKKKKEKKQHENNFIKLYCESNLTFGATRLALM